MNRGKTVEDRLYPAKITAGVVSLLALCGMLVTALVRQTYVVYLVALIAAIIIVATGVTVSLVRRARARRRQNRIER